MVLIDIAVGRILGDAHNNFYSVCNLWICVEIRQRTVDDDDDDFKFRCLWGCDYRGNHVWHGMAPYACNHFDI